MLSQAASSKYESPFRDSKRILGLFSKRLKNRRENSPFLEKKKLQKKLIKGNEHHNLGCCVGKFLSRTWVG